MELEEFLPAVCELLAIPSTADRPHELRRALEFVLDFVGPGFTVERFESGGKPSALVYRGAERPEFRVILNAHLDVVPAGDEMFRPRRDGDRLYGRGTHDMKVSGLLEAVVFRELAAGVPYPVGLQLVTDEEVGGRDGTLHQIEQGVRGGFVVIGENSGLDIVADSRGLCTVHLLARGRTAHSAYPWLGDNALVKLMRTIERVLARYPVPAREMWGTTVNVARIGTPNQAINQIPHRAEAWLDVRFTNEDTSLNGRTAEQIAEYLQGFCEAGVTAAVEHPDPPQHADHDRPEIAVLRAAARGQGYQGGFLRKHGAGDGRYYSQRGMAAVAFGIGGYGQHGPDEYVDLTTVLPYHRALRRFLLDLAPAAGESAGTGDTAQPA